MNMTSVAEQSVSPPLLCCVWTHVLALLSYTPAASTDSASTNVRVSRDRFYHPELDALRFFAFLMVFLHHALPHDPEAYVKMGAAPIVGAVLAAISKTGAFGVNVFFLLSSYLITELLLRERARFSTVDLKAFYLRRMLRIWPLYFSFLALAVAMQWFVPGQHIGWGAGLAFTFLAGNWWIVFKGFPSSVIFPLWSVSIEEQFYLVWPAWMRRVNELGLLVSAATMLLVANAARAYLAWQKAWETVIWCNTLVQLDSIALGIIVAVVLGGRPPKASTLARVALVIGGTGCLVLGGNFFQIKGDPLTPARIMLGYPTVAIGGVALLLAVLQENARLGKSGLVYLGRISYGLYVFHVLGLMISDYTVHDQTASLGRYALRVLVAFGLTVLFASISFRWLETPFLNLKERFAHVLSRPGG